MDLGLFAFWVLHVILGLGFDCDLSWACLLILNLSLIALDYCLVLGFSYCFGLRFILFWFGLLIFSWVILCWLRAKQAEAYKIKKPKGSQKGWGLCILWEDWEFLYIIRASSWKLLRAINVGDYIEKGTLVPPLSLFYFIVCYT